jgi:hypothetical protein
MLHDYLFTGLCGLAILMGIGLVVVYVRDRKERKARVRRAMYWFKHAHKYDKDEV